MSLDPNSCTCDRGAVIQWNWLHKQGAQSLFWMCKQRDGCSVRDPKVAGEWLATVQVAKCTDKRTPRDLMHASVCGKTDWSGHSTAVRAGLGLTGHRFGVYAMHVNFQ